MAHPPDSCARCSALRRATMDTAERPVSSLTFLDFNRLLRLGEHAGLDDSPAERQVWSDLHGVRDIEARLPGDGSESTAEITLSIAP